MIVREACNEDIEQIASLESEIFSDAWSGKSLTDSLNQGHVHIWVAIDKVDQVVGYLIFYTAGGEGDLARIAVAPELRRGGVAVHLMEVMWQYCDTCGYTRVLLEVRKSNIGAIGLYDNQGFEKIGIRRNYYSQPQEDAVIMEKTLDIPSSI